MCESFLMLFSLIWVSSASMFLASFDKICEKVVSVLDELLVRTNLVPTQDEIISDAN